MLSSFKKSPSIFSFVIALELVHFICKAEKPVAWHAVLKDISRPFKAALVSERKQVWITDCENKTVVILSLGGKTKGGKTKTIEHKFREPTGIAFLPVLDVVPVCDSSDCVLVLFAKNREGVLVVNCPKEISAIHIVPSF